MVCFNSKIYLLYYQPLLTNFNILPGYQLDPLGYSSLNFCLSYNILKTKQFPFLLQFLLPVFPINFMNSLSVIVACLHVALALKDYILRRCLCLRVCRSSTSSSPKERSSSSSFSSVSGFCVFCVVLFCLFGSPDSQVLGAVCDCT